MNKEDLIKKWLADELTDAELAYFKKLDDYPMHTKILESAHYFKASAVSEISGIDTIYAKRNASRTAEVIKTNWYKPLLKIAAILVVAIGVSFFFFMNKDISIDTLASQKIEVELPDASIAVVNAKSEIVFNKNKWNNKREVNLIGEAFFKVKKGSAFDVVTNYGTITVLGTQFNVKNRKNFFEVICYEGLVQVKHKEYTRNLPAGHTLRIIDGNITFETINEIRPEWISNISSFRSVPLYEVVQEFERQYNVTITLKNLDKKRLFTGGFVQDNMEDGLKSITLPLDLTYNIDTSNHIILQKK